MSGAIPCLHHLPIHRMQGQRRVTAAALKELWSGGSLPGPLLLPAGQDPPSAPVSLPIFLLQYSFVVWVWSLCASPESHGLPGRGEPGAILLWYLLHMKSRSWYAQLLLFSVCLVYSFSERKEEIKEMKGNETRRKTTFASKKTRKMTRGWTRGGMIQESPFFLVPNRLALS